MAVEPLEGRMLCSAGALDPNFGPFNPNGGPPGVFADSRHTWVDVAAVMPQADGSVMVAGLARDGQTIGPPTQFVGPETTSDLFLAKFTPAGALDTSYGNVAGGGFAFVPRPNLKTTTVYDAGQAADGSVVFLYRQSGGSSGDPGRAYLARVSAAGQLDTAFGRGGTVALPKSVLFQPHALDVSPDGTITLAGENVRNPKAAFGGAFEVMRYTAKGRGDGSFASGGAFRRKIGDGDMVTSLAVDTDGSVVVDGSVASRSSKTAGGTQTLLRLTPRGRLDRGFATGGVLTDPTGDVQSGAVTIAPDGKILTGSVKAPTDATPQFQIARYTRTGQPDATFGTAGVAVSGYASSSQEPNAITQLATDGTNVFAYGTTRPPQAEILSPQPAVYAVNAGGAPAAGADGVFSASGSAFAQGKDLYFAGGGSESVYVVALLKS